jgi:signal recognition particle subunit SRP54
LLDTAGRLHIDEVLMDEIQSVRDIAQPRETLLVVDGLTGQDAVNVATEFDGKVGISGVVLTRMDGDGRGGAALSMRAVTGKPIRFVGLGEKMDAIETFDAERVAGRILGMGDIVALVEKAQETFEAEQAERMAKRFAKGLFNMNDLKMQLEQMLKMGGMQGLMGMMPGMGKMAAQAEAAGLNDKMLHHQIALINSMTKKERANPDLLAASRKRRIAAGAGLDVAELNKLLKTASADGRHDEEDGQGRHDQTDAIKSSAGQGRHARPVQDVARTDWPNLPRAWGRASVAWAAAFPPAWAACRAGSPCLRAFPG